MSSWQYAYLFPGREMSLQPHRAIQVLKDFGLVFDPSLRMCVAIDDKGHVLNCGDEIKLDVPIEASLEERLQHGEQFSVQSGNSDIYLTSIFASQSGNPHLVIAWSKRLFLLLEDDKQQ